MRTTKAFMVVTGAMVGVERVKPRISVGKYVIGVLGHETIRKPAAPYAAEPKYTFLPAATRHCTRCVFHNVSRAEFRTVPIHSLGAGGNQRSPPTSTTRPQDNGEHLFFVPVMSAISRLSHMHAVTRFYAHWRDGWPASGWDDIPEILC